MTKEPNPTPRATRTTLLRCACGQMMLAPIVRLRTGAGHQIVGVKIGAASTVFAFAWGGDHDLAVGDAVTVEPLVAGAPSPGTVVALGSDYDGPMRMIGRQSAPSNA
jgi:hypothetical protein